MKLTLQQCLKLHRAGKWGAAETGYRAILAETPEQPDALHLLGLVLAAQKHEDQAIAMIERAIELRPKAAAYHHNIAGIYRRLGALDAAKTEFSQAFSLKPDYGEAYQGYSEMVTFEPGNDFIQRVVTQLAVPDLTDSVRSYLHFAAGKYFDDTGDWNRAFEHYRQGNQLAGKSFDRDKHQGLLKDLVYFQPDLMRHQSSEPIDEGPHPVFVVGMPRSGTSLVEQILASHSEVFGAGELNDMAQVGQQVLAQLKRLDKSGSEQGSWAEALAQAKRSAASKYLAQLRQQGEGQQVRWVVDKHPLNFRFLGMIRALLPSAKIIHIRRHPLDTCLSCYFQNFSAGQNYSFDLSNLGIFYRDYERLMSHWRDLFGADLLEIDYEDLVTNAESVITQLLAYCGLPFEAACLKFYQTDRPVSTASFKQVRQPIYHSSKARWRAYAENLRPLARILDLEAELPITVTGQQI
ncbi:MAG: sulfotransferase [Pseudomonadales bacterium]